MKAYSGLTSIVLLCLICSPIVYAKGSGKNNGIIPATPPVNVHTNSFDSDYEGYGYLNFNVTLSGQATPEFTVGPLPSDEDATYNTGDNRFVSHGLVYVTEGKLRKDQSTEKAWIGGIINAEQIDESFIEFGTQFNTLYERSGFYVGKRNTSATRIKQIDAFELDYSFVSMYAAFFLSGNSRMEAQGPETYISDFDGNSVGVMYRPMLTLQPIIRFSDYFTFIPFAGLSAFISLDYSSWELNEWEDERYGKDCFDGCPDGDLFLNLVPLESFFGFDIEIHYNKVNTVSLSSFFSTGLGINTGRMSEIYLVYTRAIN